MSSRSFPMLQISSIVCPSRAKIGTVWRQHYSMYFLIAVVIEWPVCIFSKMWKTICFCQLWQFKNQLESFHSISTQKKFRISCAFFFVLSTSNPCRLWRGWQIKVQFSEDVSCMTISNFCEKQFVLNDTTLIAQKPLFWPKNTKLHQFYV